MSVAGVGVHVLTAVPPDAASYALAVYDVAPEVAVQLAVRVVDVGEPTVGGVGAFVAPDVLGDSVVVPVTPIQ